MQRKGFEMWSHLRKLREYLMPVRKQVLGGPFSVAASSEGHPLPAHACLVPCGAGLEGQNGNQGPLGLSTRAVILQPLHLPTFPAVGLSCGTLFDFSMLMAL